MNESGKGKLIIFSAPSGSGKTTLVQHLMQKMDDLEFSISACTREKRKGEEDGKDYYFLSPGEFRQKIRNQEFVEWEEVYADHFYGTLRSEVERIRKQGKHVVFDVDVMGGLNIKKQFGNEAFAIFVRPPSLKELRKRLEKRATDDPGKIALRLKKANTELAFEKEFDTVIINDDLPKAKTETVKKVSQFITQSTRTK